MTSPQKSQRWNLTINQFLHPKTGHTLSECEDAVAKNRKGNRFAVADGATEAFDSRTWAQQIANSWVELPGCLSSCEFWQFLTDEGRALSDSWSRRKLPWYSEEKARIGSFAAFVGVDIDLLSETASWRAVALGDSCVIQLRNREIVTVLPIGSSADFGTTPVLAPSNTSLQADAATQITSDKGYFEEGDLLLLLSDAVASWLLRLSEEGDLESVSELMALLNQGDKQALRQVFANERTSKHLKDDDIAVISIQASRI